MRTASSGAAGSRQLGAAGPTPLTHTMSSNAPPPAKKRGSNNFAKRGSKLLALHLRLMSGLQLVAGGGFIAFAVLLQFPPSDPLKLGLWAIGCLAILTAICGCFGGCRIRWCLGVYVVLAVLSLAAQTGLVLYLFIAPDKAEAQLSDYQNTQGQVKDNLHEIIIIGRWVLLGLLAAQLLAIGLASCLRCCTRHSSYEEFQEDEQAEYDARQAAATDQLEQLRAKLGLAEGQAPGEADAAAVKLQIINIHAVSGTAAERQAGAAQQQRAMRSSLFQRSNDVNPDADLEAGTIGTRGATDTNNSWEAMPMQPSPTSAWPQATPSPKRSFKATWSSKAGK